MLNLNFKKQPISYANVWVAENVLDLSQARDHEKSFNRCTANSFKPYDNLLEKNFCWMIGANLITRYIA